jgi:hypothetical protein
MERICEGGSSGLPKCKCGKDAWVKGEMSNGHIEVAGEWCIECKNRIYKEVQPNFTCFSIIPTICLSAFDEPLVFSDSLSP